MAKSISHAATKYNVLSNQQFGSPPKTSAFDLDAYVIHDIQKARSAGKVGSLPKKILKGLFIQSF